MMTMFQDISVDIALRWIEVLWEKYLEDEGMVKCVCIFVYRSFFITTFISDVVQCNFTTFQWLFVDWFENRNTDKRIVEEQQESQNIDCRRSQHQLNVWQKLIVFCAVLRVRSVFLKAKIFQAKILSFYRVYRSKDGQENDNSSK
jgi:hypothetical protein